MYENYQRLAMASYHPKHANVPGYTILNEYSGPDRTVYQNNQTGKVVVAYRGTNPKNWRDLTTDAAMALNLHTHRFTNSDNITKKVIERYGKGNVSLTGHSLGGSQALYFSDKYGVHSEAYNPYIHPSNFFGVGKGHTYAHATIHHNYTDPISYGSMFVGAGKKDFRYAGIAAHGIQRPFEPKGADPHHHGGETTRTGALYHQDIKTA